jgi:hypothetical protein
MLRRSLRGPGHTSPLRTQAQTHILVAVQYRHALLSEVVARSEESLSGSCCTRTISGRLCHLSEVITYSSSSSFASRVLSQPRHKAKRFVFVIHYDGYPTHFVGVPAVYQELRLPVFGLTIPDTIYHISWRGTVRASKLGQLWCCRFYPAVECGTQCREI